MWKWWAARRIEKNIPPSLQDLIAFLGQKGFPAFLVGGSLRSLLLGQKPGDWDFAVEGSSLEIKRIFPDHRGPGGRFGTLLIRWQGRTLELTCLESRSIVQDLWRRDFTINALAWNPEQGLIDPAGGQKDLRRKIIRPTGNPRERFREDPLRIIRFFRFQAELDFAGTSSLFTAIDPTLLPGVAPERTGAEMDRLLPGIGVEKALQGMLETEVLTSIIPEFNSLLQVPGAVEHVRRTVGAIRPDPILRWAALLHDIGKGITYNPGNRPLFPDHEKEGARMAEEILTRLRLAHSRVEKITTLIRWHMFELDPMLSDGALRRFISRVGRENVMDLVELRRADIIGTTRQFHRAGPQIQAYLRRIQELLGEDQQFTRQDLAIDGHDLMEYFDLEPGPRVGELLDKAHQWILEDPSRNTREEILRYLEQDKN